MATGTQVRENGWRQGAFLPLDYVERLVSEYGYEGVTHAVVISQDCDVTYDCCDTEPFAELLMLRPVDPVDPGLVDGKSSRVLHLEAQEGTTVLGFSVKPWDQIRVPRPDLAAIKPLAAPTLRPGVLRGLIQWVADRYTRTGFPDAFVRRIALVDSKLRKLMKKEGKAFWRILVSLDSEEELESGENYEVDCVCAIWPEAWDDASEREKVESAAGRLQTILEGCDGIEIDQFEVNSMDELPMSYLLSYRTWDFFNYLSHRDLLEGDAG